MFFASFQWVSWSALSSWSLHASIILSTEGWTYDVCRVASSSFESRYTKSRTRLISEYDSWPSSNSLLPSINSSMRSLSCFMSLQILSKLRGQLISEFTSTCRSRTFADAEILALQFFRCLIEFLWSMQSSEQVVQGAWQDWTVKSCWCPIAWCLYRTSTA